MVSSHEHLPYQGLLINKEHYRLLMLQVPHYFGELLNVLAEGLTLSTSRIIISNAVVIFILFTSHRQGKVNGQLLM